ncbi:MAG: putative DNA binding domain-containing protein [Bacteroidales bacterium]|nr:putative DNA binding domain-containing protein [Bacteroidales bacterium]
MNTESQNIEFKESWRDEYLKWICGFANAQGGKIYIGVCDDGSVCGLDDSKRLMEDIPNKIVSLLGIVADVNLLQKDGKDYICIEVTPYKVPIAYKGVYHYRSGSTNQELKGAALQEFLFKKMGLTWDGAAYTSATIDCIDPNAVAYFLHKAVSSGRLPAELEKSDLKTVLENLDLFADDGKLRNAAILCFGKRPSRYFAAAEFKIGRFGASQSDLMFQDMVEGNLIQMADRVIDLLKSKYLTNPIHYEGLLRVEELEVPETALREAILNAIIHRDYTGAQIQMRVWNDRIELWNDGELPFGQTIESLKQTHSSKPRNRIIANVFYKAGFIESWGRGIDKICDGFTEKGFIEPIFEHNSGGVLCTLFRKKTAELFIGNKDVNVGENELHNDCIKTAQSITDSGTLDGSQKTTQPKLESELGSELGSKLLSCAAIMTTNRRRIIELIQDNNKISISQLADKLEISTTAVEKNINFLKANGILKRVGNTNSGYWQIIVQ